MMLIHVATIAIWVTGVHLFSKIVSCKRTQSDFPHGRFPTREKTSPKFGELLRRLPLYRQSPAESETEWREPARSVQSAVNPAILKHTSLQIQVKPLNRKKPYRFSAIPRCSTRLVEPVAAQHVFPSMKQTGAWGFPRARTPQA